MNAKNNNRQIAAPPPEMIARLLDVMDNMIVVADIETDRILFLNEPMRREMKLSEDAVGKHCHGIFKIGAGKKCPHCPKKSMPPESNESVSWEFHYPVTNKHYRVIGRFIDWHDGRRVFLEQCDEITTLRNTVSLALDAEERLQLIVDAMPVSFILWNKDFTINTCNLEALKFFGVKSINELNDNIFKLSPPTQPDGSDSDSACHAYLQKSLDAGSCRFEWTYQSTNGELRPCEVILVRIKYKNEFMIAEYTRDLREQKAYIEELTKARVDAEAANRAKSTFLANMSHEIRTPMNSIIGFTELAIDDDISSATKSYLQKIYDNAEWLLFIINDILDISKIESGKMELEKIPFDLRAVFAHCRAAILPKAEEKGLTLYCYAEPSVRRKVLGDPIRLRQALLNILTNAVKFTNSGTIKLSETIVAKTADTVTMRFEIKDSGIGMTDEQMKQVFAPFTQADSTITRKYGGTGLGLTITRNIVELMGGQMMVESAVGVGSRFWFDIVFDTIEDDGAEASQHTQNMLAIEKPNFEGEVLVCEDNPLNQQVAVEHLQRVGLRVVLAENGRVALDIIEARMRGGQKKPFDLILMDVHMPVMDGLEAAQKIIDLNVGIPIVAMTANVMVEEVEMYKKCGMQDSLGKPFTTQELWRCLAKHLSVSSLSRVGRGNPADKFSEDELKRQLRQTFYKSNQNTVNEITDAIGANDFITAHRIAHTLKSNAGQIGEKKLQEAARAAEAFLKENSGAALPNDVAAVLASEHAAVIERLAELSKANEQKRPNKAPLPKQVQKLAAALRTMLENSNPECMTYADKVRQIPNGEELAQLIEDFEFKKALDKLNELML